MSRQSVMFEVPMRTQATGNRRDHWAPRMERTAKERSDVALLGKVACRWMAAIRPLVVTLVRVWAPDDIPGKGQAALDKHDNLPQALKPVADEVTKLLGFESDRDEDLAFAYEQAEGRTPAVRVLIQGPCRAKTVIYDVEPGSLPEADGQALVTCSTPRNRRRMLKDAVPVQDPDDQAALALRNNRGVPGSNDDDVALNMAAVEGERDA